MANVYPGRYTAKLDGSFVVFVIGMRINRFWKFGKWIPVARAMGPMLRELYRHPELGFLHAEFALTWRGVQLIQYWRSFDQLEAYAGGGIHLEAWKRFNRAVGNDGSVGIFHETYLVQEGQYECMYNNMPRIGLARAGGHASIDGATETARRRLGGKNDPAVPSG